MGLVKFQAKFAKVPFSPVIDAQCPEEVASDLELMMKVRCGILDNFDCKVRDDGGVTTLQSFLRIVCISLAVFRCVRSVLERRRRGLNTSMARNTARY